MKIAVLFDGAGLARLGLERAGHECTGYEIDPAKHHLSKMVGSGNCILGDVRDFDYSGYDAIWASPPCQKRSDANENDLSNVKYSDLDNLLIWSLNLPHRILWVENVIESGGWNSWGKKFNAAQFTPIPIQSRNRIIGGRYCEPFVFRSYQRMYGDYDICPTILASEYKGGVSGDATKERRKAMRWYGRPLALSEMAYHQGFSIPDELLKSWYQVPHLLKPNGKRYTWKQWRIVLSEAIGNGVPCYMSYMFGLVYSDKTTDYYGNELPLKQVALF